MRPTRVVVCTAAVGCGHTRAALAVREGILAHEPDARIDFVETLDYASPWFVRPYRDGYLAVVARVPALAGWIYRATDRPDPRGGNGGLGRAIELRALRRFATLPTLARADVIVTTHFLCARVLGGLKQAGLITAPVAVCVTDVHPHAVWLGGGSGIDAVMVADETSRAAALRAGVRNITPTGIPIDRRFETAPDKAAARAQLGLPPIGHPRPVLLVAGGGLGLGGIRSVVELLMQAPRGLHIAVICGRNKALKAALTHLQRDWRTAAAHEPSCSIEGFTTNMPQWMAAADLMVGKPGGLTTAEACAVGLPMVLLKPLPGQEERNADHLCTRGAATLEPTDTGAARAAISLAFNTDRLATMATAARQLGKPRAALDAAAVALALVDHSRHFNATPAATNDDSLIPEQGLASLPCVVG